MIYPEFIKEKDVIGVTAPSDGITEEGKVKRLNFAIHNFKQLGFQIKETQNVRTSRKGRSSNPEERAKELEDLYLNSTVKMIMCAAGGDFLLEVLPYLSFDLIQQYPKWIQGYSDPTGLLFTITTNLDIATIYSDNFAQFGMIPWHESLKNNLEILKGNILEQKSFSKYANSHCEYILGSETYPLDTPVLWKNITGEDEIKISGRMIGGCIDILSELFGTRFDHTKEFIAKYQQDGIIWYFDNCELSSENLIRTLWKMKDNGWFSYTNGFIFGRSATESSYYDISFQDAILYCLKDINVPIIINADFGHIAPRMTIINGAIAHIISHHGKGSIQFELK